MGSLPPGLVCLRSYHEKLDPQDPREEGRQAACLQG